MAYRHIVFSDDHELLEAEGVGILLRALKAGGYQLGMIIAGDLETYGEEDSLWNKYSEFDCVLHGGAREEPELDTELLNEYKKRFGVTEREILYIGCSMHDMESASAAGVDGGLALWCCEKLRHTWASYYFNQPYDVWNQLDKNMQPFKGREWVSMAMELQFIAQAGLTYTKDVFDKERFQRVREISAQAMALGTGFPMSHISDVFCNETGFQTPKLDTRAAVFQDDRILLVKEKDGRWSLPGGWVDVNQSIGKNVVKETREEAGLDVVPVRLIALHDRNQHNVPVYAYGICKVFILCAVISGKFEENNETLESGYFDRDNLPPLAQEKNTPAQVQMCFEAYYDEHWNPVID